MVVNYEIAHDYRGGRIPPDMVDRAEITATFRILPDGAAARWLADNELDVDGDCLLRRTIGADGRSRAASMKLQAAGMIEPKELA